MDQLLAVAMLLVSFKLLTLVVGLVVIWLGYRLFVLGIYEKAGELAGR